VPRLCGFYPGFCLTTEEKHGKTSVRLAIDFTLETPSERKEEGWLYLRNMSGQKNVAVLSHTYVPRYEESLLILENIRTDQDGDHDS